MPSSQAGLHEEPPAPDFQALFLAHYGFVCRALRSMQVDAASIEDLAQDVFIVLHRRLDDYDPCRDVRSWLWGIARRVASTHARSAHRAERRLHALPDPAPARPLDERVELQQRADVVTDFLGALPADQREVFVLMELESMSAPEVAQALGLKLNTVYSRLRAARERFKRAVARHQAREERVAHA
ncbi:MAG: sigma-70 family RNA polymerase sigma factor [Myxococcales bacterium]|nr:sigma-70 family RNA polymerase sigma factor [Myxococcales bacterium]